MKSVRIIGKHEISTFLHLHWGVYDTPKNLEKYPKKMGNYLLLVGRKGGKNDQNMMFFIKTENIIF